MTSFENLKKIKTEAYEDELRQKIEQAEKLSKENSYLKAFCSDQTEQIQILEASKKNLEAIGTKLNNQITTTILKHNEEIAATKKDSRYKVKILEKELGFERKIKIKLEKKLDELENTQVDIAMKPEITETSSQTDTDLNSSKSS